MEAITYCCARNADDLKWRRRCDRNRNRNRNRNRKLKGVVKELTAAINDVQEQVDAALGNNQVIRQRVQTWLTRAAAVQAQATQLKDKAAAAADINSSSSSWIKGWCTCCSRSRNNILSSSTEVKDMVRVIEDLLRERQDLFSNNDPYFESYRVYIDFPSRKATAERVMVALKKDEIRLVGLYGMPGVGKTMLVEALSQQAKEELLFDEVVMVSLSSQSLDLRSIQDNVAMQLDLMLEENESDISRAESISQRLLEHTNVLVVLDNLWERVELEKLGIPLGNTTTKKRCCCCKVVFTTRDQSVCDEMETDEKIQVVVLSEEDSWSLFRQSAGGDELASSSGFQVRSIFVKDALNECKGLPLAIVTLGITLRHAAVKRITSSISWANALLVLREWIYAGMGPITSSIRLSFCWLQGKNVEYAFLYCCLFPKDLKIEIEVLLFYLTGERLVVTDALNECKGLPLAIVTLGITLRYTAGKWNRVLALALLRWWIHAGMGSITSSIRLSFRRLHGENVRYVFLFCCLFPKDFKIEIEVLLCYLMGEGVLEGVLEYKYSSLGEARSLLDDAIGYLASSPLLLYDKEDLKHVWMNDVVRDAAIDIASKDGFLVKDGMTLTTCTDTECQKLFVMGTKVRCGLPNRLEAPSLRTLSLNSYNDLNEIPPEFFTEMPNLVVLDLSNADIESLPRSLPCLVNLRTLLMKNCRKLKDVSLIEKLENLIILDLSGSNIQRLPKVRIANLKWYHV